MAANDVFYNHFHRAIYSFEMLKEVLVRAGFEAPNICKSAYRTSNVTELNQDSDGDDRLAVSLYVEATK